MPHFGKHCMDKTFYTAEAFLMMGLISFFLVRLACSGEIGVCSYLRDSVFLFKAGVITSFANVVIIKIVDSGLTETMVNYQTCLLIGSNLHSSWKLHSLLSCEHRSLHSAVWPESAFRNQITPLTGCWCISNQYKTRIICSRSVTFLNCSFVVHSAVFLIKKMCFHMLSPLHRHMHTHTYRHFFSSLPT